MKFGYRVCRALVRAIDNQGPQDHTKQRKDDEKNQIIDKPPRCAQEFEVLEEFACVHEWTTCLHHKQTRREFKTRNADERPKA